MNNTDEIDKRLYKDLQEDIQIPDRYKEVIEECLNNDLEYEKKHSYKLAKIIATVCASLILSVGIVYAGTKVYDKVWKEPKRVVGFKSENDKEAKIISETEAKKNAEEILKKFDYEKANIKSIELTSNEKSYKVKADKDITIYFSAQDGNLNSLFIDSVLNEKIHNYRTTKEKAEETARNFCKKYGYDLSTYTHTKISSNMNSEEESYIWDVSFYKEYNGIVNPYEYIYISFIPEINKVYFFSVMDKSPENNPIEISKEEAQETALSEDKKIDIKYDIEDVYTELGIISMNGDAYLRVNDYEQLHKQTSMDYPIEERISYDTDNRIRMAWIVTIKYDISQAKKLNASYNINDRQFSYYIDATTGEIIGGCSNYKTMVKSAFE